MEDNIYSGDNSSSQIVSLDYVASTNLATSDINYLLPRQVGTGSTRGTQTIGTGNINIDGSDNQITIGSTNSTSSIVIGNQTIVSNQTGVAASSLSASSGGFGLSITDSNNASINLGINSAGNVELLFNDGANNRLLVGQDSDGQEVILISKPGVEVTTATLPGLAFSSSASFTVLLQGSYTFPSLGSVGSGMTAVSVTQPFAHNAGFIPSANVFAPFTVGGFSLPGLPTGFPQTTAFVPIVSGALVYQSDLSNSQIIWGVDTTNLYLGQIFSNDEATPQIALPVTVYYAVYTLNATA